MRSRDAEAGLLHQATPASSSSGIQLGRLLAAHVHRDVFASLTDA